MDIIKLTNENIDMLSGKISAMYKSAGCDKKECMRARLILEEALIKYKNRFGEEVELYYKEYSILSQKRFIVRLRTPSFDPFTLEENPMAFMIDSIMSSFEGNMPMWKYRNLENELMFTIRTKAKVNGAVKIGIACVVAIILGFLSKAFLPETVLHTFVSDYLSPLADAYSGLFCVMAVLLSFFAIVLSIVHIGDVALVGEIGGKIMQRFYFMALAIVVIATLPTLLLYDISGTGSVSFAAKSIYDILIDFIPSNLIQPFLDFNSVQLMIIGAMFGTSLLVMGQKGENLTKVFDECNLVAIYTNGFLNKFISIFVGMKIFEIIVASDFSAITYAGKVISLIVVGEVALFIFYTIYVCAKTKIRPLKYLKAIMPAFVVCLSSANFGAAFSTMFDGFKELDTVDDRVSLSVSIGGVVYRPACMLVFVFSSFAFAQMNGVEMSIIWVCMAILLSVILVAAVPNAPGVSVAVITLLYSQLGIPASAIALMIAINAPLQFLTVAVDTYCLAGECICFSKEGKKKKEK